MPPKIKLGELLVKSNVITPEQLELALNEQQTSKEFLGEILLRLGFVDEEEMYLPILAEQIGVEYVNLRKIFISPEVIAKIPAKYAYYYKVMPIAYKDGVVTIAMRNPLDIRVIDGISQVMKFKAKSALSSEKDIRDCIRKYYGVGAETIEQIMNSIDINKRSEPATGMKGEIESEASLSKFVNQILVEAYQRRATDMHVEPYENELRIRYRIDGVLYDANVPANIKYFRDSINSRIKILSNLDIAEKRLPQDGRFKIRVDPSRREAENEGAHSQNPSTKENGFDLDLRVSFLPTPFGESVVIRILNSLKLYSLEDLGLAQSELMLLDQMIKRPHGIIFLTGPTGSGKTTTLYACLTKINNIDRKIITIEDPIEYQLKGITQTQVNPLIGYSFANGLRSILRHDPDIMMVGEVRDIETAKITIQVALTGHLVFSTLHTNDAASGITRLLDMGIEAYLISSSVNCFIAQRLVRMICVRCKTQDTLTPEIIREFGISNEYFSSIKIYKGEGCEDCQMTGYHGRQAIYEFLSITDEIRDMIMERATAGQIRSKAINQGMKTLRQDGWERVKGGFTTASEVLRVTQEEVVG